METFNYIKHIDKQELVCALVRSIKCFIFVVVCVCLPWLQVRNIEKY